MTNVSEYSVRLQIAVGDVYQIADWDLFFSDIFTYISVIDQCYTGLTHSLTLVFL